MKYKKTFKLPFNNNYHLSCKILFASNANKSFDLYNKSMREVTYRFAFSLTADHFKISTATSSADLYI